jgi:hypothetical protein
VIQISLPPSVVLTLLSRSTLLSGGGVVRKRWRRSKKPSRWAASWRPATPRPTPRMSLNKLSVRLGEVETRNDVNRARVETADVVASKPLVAEPAVTFPMGGEGSAHGRMVGARNKLLVQPPEPDRGRIRDRAEPLLLVFLPHAQTPTGSSLEPSIGGEIQERHSSVISSQPPDCCGAPSALWERRRDPRGGAG